MTDKERYQKTFSALVPERDYLEKVKNGGVIKMNTKKRISMPKLLAACIAIIVVIAALSAGVYAADVGGIQRKIQVWTRGELTDAELDITTDGQYTVSYTDENGETRKQEGGGVAYDLFGRERPLTEEEIIEQLNEPTVIREDDGRIMLYCRDQALDLTEKFEKGVCHVKLAIDGKNLYVTVRLEDNGGIAMSTSRHSYPMF